MPCASFVCFMHSDDSGVEVHSMHAECQESEAVMVTAPLQRALRHCCFRALWQHVELLRCMCTSCATTTSSLPVSESHDPCPTCHTQPPPLCTKRAIESLRDCMLQCGNLPNTLTSPDPWQLPSHQSTHHAALPPRKTQGAHRHAQVLGLSK